MYVFVSALGLHVLSADDDLLRPIVPAANAATEAEAEPISDVVTDMPVDPGKTPSNVVPAETVPQMLTEPAVNPSPGALFPPTVAPVTPAVAAQPTSVASKQDYPEYVTVLANYASVPVAFWLVEDNGQRVAKQLRKRETISLPYSPGAEVIFMKKNEEVGRRLLLADGIQVFSDHEGNLDLYLLGPDYIREVNTQHGATPAPTKAAMGAGPAAPGSPVGPISPTMTLAEKPRILVIPVRVLCDDKVPLVKDVWERRVRARLKVASDILERTCLIRLHIVDVDTWKSDNDAADIRELLRDFQKKVQVAPATLAIGFTAHRNWGKNGITELGVAGHPFFPYILLREAAPQTTEVERLETLLHELGHYLGAAHSSDENSIMRTVMKDRRGRVADFVITFDPLNTLAMNLWIRQYYRNKGPFPPYQVDADLRKKLVSVYQLFQKAAHFQAANSDKKPEVNPNVEFLLALLGEKNVQLAEGVVVQDPEKEKTISKVAETAYDPEDPLGLLDKQNQSNPEKVITEEGLNSDAMLKEIERQEKQAAKSPTPKSVEKPAATTQPVREDPNDPLGIKNMQQPDVAPGTATAAPGDIGAVVTETMDTTMPDPIPDKPLRSGLWKTEVVEKFQLPTRTTQYIITGTLMSLTQKSPLKAVAPSEFKEDAFTETLIRYAAEAALQVGGDMPANTLEGKIARQAFLLALGILLEPEESLQTKLPPPLNKRFRDLETDVLQKNRRNNVKNVCALGRGDLCQHFSVSAALTAHLAPSAVEDIGVSKEFYDNRPGGSGFDVTDLNADIAGVLFSVAVQEGKISLKQIADGFRFVDYIPTKIDMPSELKKPQNNKQAEETVRHLKEGINKLPAYK